MMTIHTVFDILAWSGGALLGWVMQRFFLPPQTRISPLLHPVYFASAMLGIVGGAYGIGTLNLVVSGVEGVGRSVVGGLFGAIVAIELYKRVRGVRGSTGLAFVASLSFGTAVGRIGCLLAGLDDYTYGIPTGAAWGWDFGDGILRHPVALYESVTMALFLAFFLVGVWRRWAVVMVHGFYLYVAVYAVQRFCWEFLKPYGAVWGPFNIFHLVCLCMMIYAGLMVLEQRKNHA